MRPHPVAILRSVARQDDELCRHEMIPRTCTICRATTKGANRLLYGKCQHGNRPEKCETCEKDRRLGKDIQFARKNPQCPDCRDFIKEPGLCTRCVNRRQRLERRQSKDISSTSPRASCSPERPLRKWQVEALASWKQYDRKAVVEAATGTGKTMLACAAIADIRAEAGSDTRVVVVVPTQVLASQWRQALTSTLHILDTSIGEQHSAAKIEWKNSEHPVLITVINTGRNHLERVLSTWHTEGRKVLLIVDECHRAGAATNSRIFDGHFDFSLGLSATPERPDEGEETHIYPNIGKKAYSYPLKTALDDGVLPDFTSINMYVDFTSREKWAWDESTEDLGKAIYSLKAQHPEIDSGSSNFFNAVRKLAESDNHTARRVEALLAARRDLLSASTGRQKCLSDLLKILSTTRKRFIVFHESIAAAEATRQELLKLGVKTSIDHSQMKPQVRVSERDRFSVGRSQAMVAVRSLDEGVDVPEAEIAIIASGSRSRRQRIQRMGRVLRFVEGKHALSISLLVRGTVEETVTGAGDKNLVGPERVRHHCYGKSSPKVAFDPWSPSSHTPPATGLRTEVDRLTYRFIQRVSPDPNKK